MQVARHADTNGFKKRPDPPYRPSRQHVTPAFDDDKPYDPLPQKGQIADEERYCNDGAGGRGLVARGFNFGSISTPPPCDREN